MIPKTGELGCRLIKIKIENLFLNILIKYHSNPLSTVNLYLKIQYGMLEGDEACKLIPKKTFNTTSNKLIKLFGNSSY